MGRSHESFSKREKEKKKKKRKEDKLKRKEDRQEDGGGKSFEDMIAYVDNKGNIVDTPPDPSEKEEIEAEDIVLGIPPKSESDEVMVNEGTVSFFDDSKGFGFIKVQGSQESLFTHVSRHEDEIKEGNKVSFDVEPGDRGPVAVNVRIMK
ncbi:MAG: cold shock CspA family protein [Cryomorphaceae bacterium]|jgi:cold shock CspA family protein